MDITISPGSLRGTVTAIPSKSQAHRVLICAAFADKTTKIQCKQTNDDIEATADCLRSLGAQINRTADGYEVLPIINIPSQATLNCAESGSTLRFMLPITGALGVDATFEMSGRLPQRPLSPLWEEMKRMGCELSRPTASTIRCRGKLQAGIYTIDGGVSSQFITGLLFATALIPGESEIHITGKLESAPYIRLTQQVLEEFGVHTHNYSICGAFPFSSKGAFAIEGDWSNAAFFLAAQVMGNSVKMIGLNSASTQGDSACAQILDEISKKHVTVDCKDIPDLVPILAVAAASKFGAVFSNIARLRLKESDRVKSVLDMLNALGAKGSADDNKMYILPSRFHGGTVNAANDHRIAMAAAIAASVSSEPVNILGADCVKKSYPSFWDVYRQLGGNYEQYIR